MVKSYYFKRQEGKSLTEWNQILHEEWYSRKEPEEVVVDFIRLLNAKDKKLRFLDVGCGAGRHTVYMAKQGFEAHGIDISETGLNVAKTRLKEQRLRGHLVKCDMKLLPYVDSCFDAVICLHAIYHQRRKEIQETIAEIQRTLRKNGFLLANFLSKRTYSCGKGMKVEDATFMELEGVEKGVLHHFVDKEDIELFFKNFKILDLKLVENEVEGKLRSRWVLIATK